MSEVKWFVVFLLLSLQALAFGFHPMNAALSSSSNEDEDDSTSSSEEDNQNFRSFDKRTVQDYFPGPYDNLNEEKRRVRNFLRFGRTQPVERIYRSDNNQSPMAYGLGIPDEDSLTQKQMKRAYDQHFVRFGKSYDNNYVRYGRSTDSLAENKNNNLEHPRSKRSTLALYDDTLFRNPEMSSSLAAKLQQSIPSNFLLGSKKFSSIPLSKRGRGNSRHFIRYGRDPLDLHFLRFGKRVSSESSEEESKEDFKRFLGSSSNLKNFVRYG